LSSGKGQAEALAKLRKQLEGEIEELKNQLDDMTTAKGKSDKVKRDFEAQVTTLHEEIEDITSQKDEIDASKRKTEGDLNDIKKNCLKQKMLKTKRKN